MIVNIKLTWDLMWPNFVLFWICWGMAGYAYTMYTPDTLSRKYSYLCRPNET